MTKIQMPEPAGKGMYLLDEVGNLVPTGYTPDQMEAYAEARVREALEEALIEVMRCKTSGIIRNDTVDKCADAIRALIPKEDI